jgi:hypothetical protein
VCVCVCVSQGSPSPRTNVQCVCVCVKPPSLSIISALCVWRIYSFARSTVSAHRCTVCVCVYVCVYGTYVPCVPACVSTLLQRAPPPRSDVQCVCVCVCVCVCAVGHTDYTLFITLFEYAMYVCLLCISLSFAIISSTGRDICALACVVYLLYCEEHRLRAQMCSVCAHTHAQCVCVCNIVLLKLQICVCVCV